MANRPANARLPQAPDEECWWAATGVGRNSPVQDWFIPGSSSVCYVTVMKAPHRVILASVLACVVGSPAAAQMRELEQDELRRSVQTGESVSLQRILSLVSSRVDAEILDVRAFEGGGIYYRVLIKQANGRLGSVVLDAGSGQFMGAKSSVAQDVVKSAKSSRWSGNSLTAPDRAGKANQSGGVNDRGRSSIGNNSAGSTGGGKSGGNAGGNNGGGNAGGNNGGGNAGGNNGGGNAGGNSGGGNAGGNNGGGNAGGNNGGGNAGGNNAGGKK